MTTSFCFISENSAEQVYSVSDNKEQRTGARTAERAQRSHGTEAGDVRLQNEQGLMSKDRSKEA